MVKNMEGNNDAEQRRGFFKPIDSGNKTQFYAQKPKVNDFSRRMFTMDTMIFNRIHYPRENDLPYRANRQESNFINALESIKDCDDLILEYLTTIEELGEIGPVLAAQRVINNFSDEDVNNPVI